MKYLLMLRDDKFHSHFLILKRYINLDMAKRERKELAKRSLYELENLIVFEDLTSKER